MPIRMIAAFTAAALAVAPAAAQDFKAETREGVDYVQIQMIKFKPGGGKRAQELEEKYFFAADKAAGNSYPVIVHPQTGDWDAIYMFPMKGGLADMQYRMSPSDAAFMTALAKSIGGKAKAEKMLEEWDGLAERRVTNVGHVHRAPQ